MPGKPVVMRFSELMIKANNDTENTKNSMQYKTLLLIGKFRKL